MSHFTVLVVGDNHEAALQPFHEFECTGIVDEFVQDIDITEEVREQIRKHYEENGDENAALEYGLDYYGLGNKQITPEREKFVDRNGAHKFGWAVVKHGELIKAVNRTNPNAKWDWYSVGGRWTGFFKLLPNSPGRIGRPGVMMKPVTDRTRADQARLRDIDIAGMFDEAESEARGRYQKVSRLLGGQIPRMQYTWGQVREQFADKTIEEQREIYHGQEALRTLNKAVENIEDKEDKHALMFLELEIFQCTEDEYAKKFRDKAIQTFAVLKDGKWYERGEMGWWGCVSNEKANEEWQQEFNKLFTELDPDTLLTVVDCHI